MVSIATTTMQSEAMRRSGAIDKRAGDGAAKAQ
jgi:hypothetical protein